MKRLPWVLAEKIRQLSGRQLHLASAGHLASGGLPGFRWTNRSCGRDCQAAETLRECRAAQMELRPPPVGPKKTAAGTYY
jgi:hypothetical protein